MTAPSKSFVTIADTQVDADSPLDSVLLTGLRDNAIHNHEWIGYGYTPAQAHTHDGVNSALVATVADGGITTAKLANGSVTLAKLSLLEASWTGSMGAGNSVELTVNQYHHPYQVYNGSSGYAVQAFPGTTGNTPGWHGTYLLKNLGTITQDIGYKWNYHN